MAENYDIVVIGAGPTGLMFTACMLRLGKYKIKHIDDRAEPTKTGRADGIQPRTLDILQNLGLKRNIMSENPGRIYETAFWNPMGQSQESIERTSTWRSFPESIDTRYPFSTILHQGRIESIFLDDLKQKGLKVDRPWSIDSFGDSKDTQYPIEVRLVDAHGTQRSSIKTKYIFGADGARSMVREKLGIEMKERPSPQQMWSVIDGVVKTNFPDILMKCTVHSSSGSAMIIPHGQNVVRIYVQIFPPLEEPRMSSTVTQIKQAAQQIFRPYWMEWERVDWYSSYHIGQAVASKYSMNEQIFIGGDACHTHSPKAGQGMNYGMADAHNLAWKLHLVECAFLDRRILQTYEGERKLVANALINFDAGYADLFCEQSPCSNGEEKSELNNRRMDFINKHKSTLTLVSGYGVRYPNNILNWGPRYPENSTMSVFSPPGIKLAPGSIFPHATVTRVIDAHVTYLEQDIPFNGSYRIYIFAGEPARTRQAMLDFARGFEESPFFSRFRHPAIDASFDGRHNPHSPFFSFCIVFNAFRESIDISTALPEFFSQCRYHVYADDELYGKYSALKGSVHAKMGVDPQLGGLVVVRPDGYVGCTLSLMEGSAISRGLAEYFQEGAGE
ncbi:phenol 2-monooxygenase [Penicillium nucicola]|uniref:phenol 2-monooxygenase n=1 Tax=Penicillium nucicola TaxID=1850975 RepID=UPI002544F00E|nr:phenol 2-monooxygenase [Penicillium nucicola]KAJ5753942.1 phenol 2-monooxygenase [Penicillium nucicola]